MNVIAADNGMWKSNIFFMYYIVNKYFWVPTLHQALWMRGHSSSFQNVYNAENWSFTHTEILKAIW